ncbi:MAG: GMC family oxidoreductase [Deltaproteobacteria bacterium]|nr:GMC family oxidoreductase [Deltaproteobacteria bacterium]
MEEADAVIIGSGYGGAIPAARLAEAGMSVVVLERGPRRSTADLRQSDDPRYLQTAVDLVIGSDNVAFRTGTMMGGASIAMDGAHFRMPAKSYEVEDGAGRRLWPQAYDKDAMRPHYERAEQMLKVRQLGWDEIAKTGGLFAKMLSLVGASCERARLNYTDCLQCGFCAQGCIYDKKMHLLHTYLPVAESHGAELRAGAMVDHIEPSGSGHVAHYRRGGQSKQIFSARMIVACGGIHSPALLLRSAAWLPKLSQHLGEHFNNNGEHGFVGILPPEFDRLDRYWCYQGMDNAGMMSFHWFEEEGFTLHPGGGIEPSIFAASVDAAGDAVLPARAWGMAYKRFVESVYPHRVIAFSALGLAPGHRAVIVKDNGTPDFAPRDRSAADAYLDRLEQIVFAVGKKTGVAVVPSAPRPLAGTTSAHLLSACRMAESADHGVVGPDGQVFGYEKLYVCDASIVPCALGVNPALTISALAERIAEGIVQDG